MEVFFWRGSGRPEAIASARALIAQSSERRGVKGRRVIFADGLEVVEIFIEIGFVCVVLGVGFVEEGVAENALDVCSRREVGITSVATPALWH